MPLTQSNTTPVRYFPREGTTSAIICQASVTFAPWCVAQKSLNHSSGMTGTRPHRRKQEKYIRMYWHAQQHSCCCRIRVLRLQLKASAPIRQAGVHPLTIEELLRLQNIVIADTRFLKMGLRKEGGFVGIHDRDHGTPLPDHITARWQDLPQLVQGMIATDIRLRGDGTLDPIIAAAMIAFGFVFIHPFADGNGRIHRYLIHHVLTDRGFAPKGIVFPVSAVILKRIDEYRQVLESYSRPRLSHIQWNATADGNVEVINETIDLYRYFDATRQAEFLYDYVVETIEHSLPEEISFLERYDRMKAEIDNRFDMPDRMADLLIRFLRQNNGKFSKRASDKEFKALSAAERRELETIYAAIFLE
jgi:hypothetical protein